VALEELPEGFRIAFDMSAEQLLVGWRSLADTCVSRLARPWQDGTAGTATMVGFRADPSP
jgi:hypothetical protein